MATGFFKVPEPLNEAVKSYAPGSPERTEVQNMYRELYKQQINVPLYIGDQEIITDKKVAMSPPHDHKHILGYYHEANESHVKLAIESALEARKKMVKNALGK